MKIIIIVPLQVCKRGKLGGRGSQSQVAAVDFIRLEMEI